MILDLSSDSNMKDSFFFKPHPPKVDAGFIFIENKSLFSSFEENKFFK